MSRNHRYETSCTWTGAGERGSADYRAYQRSYETSSPGRPTLFGSSDPAFRGDAERWNPEVLLVASLSQCHLLSYLHRCAVNGVTVTSYTDDAEGTMVEDEDGGGHFERVVLRPVVSVADAGMLDQAIALHAEAATRCFIASSVNFPVDHEPRVDVSQGAPHPASSVPASESREP